MKGDGFANDGMSTGCAYIDFCRDEEFAHECNEHATCVSLDRGQYDCVCADGFAKIGQGRGSDGCVNVNECEDFKTNDCHIGAKCNDLVPSESNGFQKYVFSKILLTAKYSELEIADLTGHKKSNIGRTQAGKTYFSRQSMSKLVQMIESIPKI